MRNSGIQELLTLGDEPELLVVADQAGLRLDDQIPGEALRVLDTGTHDLRAKARAAVVGVDHETPKARSRLGGEDAGAAGEGVVVKQCEDCLLYTSDAADDSTEV